MLICIVGLGLGSQKDYQEPPVSTPGTQEEATGGAIYGLFAVALGVLTPFLFACSGLVVRTFSEWYGYDPVDMTVHTYVGNNIILIIAMIFTFQYGSHAFYLPEYLTIAASGLITAIGVVFLNYALTIGFAGPVFALANIQVIIQSTLDAILLGQIPSVIEVVAAIFGILGSCTIAVGPQIYDRFVEWYQKEKDD